LAHIGSSSSPTSAIFSSLVRDQTGALSGKSPGQSRDDDERIEPGLKIDDDDQIDKHNSLGKSEIKLGVGAGHGLNLATHHHMGAARRVLSGLVQDPVDFSRDRAEIA
jgi:hypothetical protein